MVETLTDSTAQEFRISKDEGANGSEQAPNSEALNRVNNIILSGAPSFELSVDSNPNKINSVSVENGEPTYTLEGDTLFVNFGSSVLSYQVAKALSGSNQISFSGSAGIQISNVSGSGGSISLSGGSEMGPIEIRSGSKESSSHPKIIVFLPPRKNISITSEHLSIQVETPAGMSVQEKIEYLQTILIPKEKAKKVEKSNQKKEKAIEKKEKYTQKAKEKRAKAIEKREAKEKKAQAKEAKARQKEAEAVAAERQGKASKATSKRQDARSALSDAATYRLEGERDYSAYLLEATEYDNQAQVEFDSIMAEISAVEEKAASKIAALEAQVEELQLQEKQ